VRRGACDLDFLDVVTSCSQTISDGVDGLDGIELGFFFAVRQSEIVSKRDPHVA
jgi:hypothetical protein